ncbi:hypothetical protein BJY00DRAFT_308096 [Aspergillus carlsbadensis]|nr:hypothetical protein BJY00DRAFT_308096 [Aspergillus carlsbadensis]
MTSVHAHSTGIRNPRAPRDEKTPSSPVVSEGFQSEIVEQHHHCRKHGETVRERKLGGYRSRGSQAANHAGTRMTPLRRRGGGSKDATAPAIKEVEHSRRPVQKRKDSSSKVFPRESTREVWLTNDPVHLEEGSGETVVMIGDSERHHLELAKLYGLAVSEGGKVLDDDGEVIGRVVEGELEDLIGQTVDDDGEILDENGDFIGRVDVLREGEDGAREEEFHVFEGLKANKQGNVMDAEGVPVARVVSGTAVEGREIGRDGRIRDCNGTVIGEVELIPEDERLYAIVRQMRDAVEPLRRQMKLASRASRTMSGSENLAKDFKPLVEDARLALHECDTALRAHTSNQAEPVDRHLADLIKELGESVVDTIDSACQITADSHASQLIHPLITLLVEPPLRVTVAIALRVVGFYARILNSVGIGKILRAVLRRLGVYRRLEEFGLGAVIDVLELGSGN